MVSPDSLGTACPLSGRNSTYRPVQISETSSLGQIVTLALPSVVAAAQSGNLSIGGIVSQVIAGGAGGAILTAIIGAIKNKAMA
jgi:hypothetical protein